MDMEIRSFIKLIFCLVFFLGIAFPALGQTTAQEWCAAAWSSSTVDDAILCYTKAIELDPDYVSAYVFRGKFKKDAGDIKGAIEDYTKAIERSPQYGDAYYLRGQARQAIGDEKGARQDIEKGQQLLKTVDHDLQFMEKQIVKDPKNIDLYWEKAIHLHLNGNYAKAVKAFDKYFQLVGRPKSDLPYQYRASAKIAIGDFNGAYKDYNLMIKMFPDSDIGYRKRAALREKRGDKKGAQEDLLKAEQKVKEMRERKQIQAMEELKQLDKDLTDPASLMKRVKIRWKGEDYKGMIEDLDALINQDLQGLERQFLGDAYYLRSLAKGELGDKQGQKADIRRMRKAAKELMEVQEKWEEKRASSTVTN